MGFQGQDIERECLSAGQELEAEELGLFEEVQESTSTQDDQKEN